MPRVLEYIKRVPRAAEVKKLMTKKDANTTDAESAAAKPTEARVMFGVLYNRPTPAVTRRANLDCINCMDGEQQRLKNSNKQKAQDEKIKK